MVAAVGVDIVSIPSPERDPCTCVPWGAGPSKEFTVILTLASSKVDKVDWGRTPLFGQYESRHPTSRFFG